MGGNGQWCTRLVLRWVVCWGTWLCLTGHGTPPSARAGESFAESPFSKPAFAASPAELLEWAAKCDYDLGRANAEVLLDEVHYRIDDTGKETATVRQIHRCLTRDAFDEYGVVQAAWTAWHQERPTIRARVITSDGQAHLLDEKTIEEVQIPSGQANVFTDARLLRAPLPAVAVGCVIETEVVTVEHRPFSTAGAADTFQLGSLFAPTRHVHVVLEVPASAPLKYRVLKSDAVPVAGHDGDRQTVTVTLGPVAALRDQWEMNTPSDMAPVPLFIFSTSPSWQEVAREYATIVEQQLADSELPAVVRSVLGSGSEKGPREVAELLLEFIKQQTRYTAVSFGSARIVPQKPQETLTRQYGDCKDLATLYVGLLRAAGVQADVVLLNSGSGMDTMPDLPRLNSFDHAIVLVRGDAPLWVDPTGRFSPMGELPTDDQGRLALVANNASSELMRTPRGTASENLVTSHNVITMLDTSPPKASTVLTYHGASAHAVRASLASGDQQQRREWMRQQGVDWFGTDKLADLSCSEPDDLKTPLQIKTVFEQVRTAEVAHPEAWALVPLYEPFEWLPFELTGPPDASQTATPEDGAEGKKQRELPLVLPVPARYEFEYRLVPAPGFVLVKLPDSQVLDLGPAKLEVTYRTEVDNSVSVRIVLDSGEGRFSAEEVRESRKQIQALGDNKGYRAWQATLQFEQTAGKHLEAGRLREAVVAYHELLQKHPDESFRHSQFARAVLQLGLGDLARTHARRAVELAPEDANAWSTLGFVLAHNEIGQYLTPGFDRAGSVEAHRKALELAPDDLGTRWAYAGVLEFDEHGLIFTNPEFVDAAIAEFERVYEKYKDDTLLDNLVSAMYVRGRTEEAKKLLESAAASATRDLLLLLGIARAESVDACLKRAAEMRPIATQRQALLERLTMMLSYFREYRAAEELIRKAAEESPQKELMLRRADSISRISRYEPEKEQADDPIGLVRHAMSAALVHGTASSQLQRFFVNVPERNEGAFDWGLPDWLDSLRNLLLNANYPPDRMVDNVTEFNFETAESGTDFFRVRVTHKNIPSCSWTAIVLRGEQGLRLYRPGHQQSELGRQALNLLAAGKEDEARRWLDWAHDQQPQDTSAFTRLFDQFAGSPFSRLWAVGQKDQRDVQVAAAALVAVSKSPEQALPILEANRADLDAARQLQVDRALVAGYSELGDHEKAASLASALRTQYPRAEEPVGRELYERARLKDLEAVEKLVAECASTKWTRLAGQLALAETTTARGDADKAKEVLSALAQQRDASPAAMVRTAWLSLFQHPALEGNLTLATSALKDAQSTETPERSKAEKAAQPPYIVALIDAGQLSEAVNALHGMQALDAYSRANSLDKLALACIAEQCGLHEHARKLLQEVEQGKGHAINSLFDLAQKRLQWIADAEDGGDGKSARD